MSWWKEFVGSAEEVGRSGLSATLGTGAQLMRLGRAMDFTPDGYREWWEKMYGMEPGGLDQATDALIGSTQDLARSTMPEDNRGFRERFADKPVESVLRAGASAIPGMAAVAAGTMAAGPAGGGAAAALVSGPTAGLDAYDSAVAHGADKGTAIGIGATVGTLTALLDRIGGRALAEPLEKGIFGAAREAVKKGATKDLAKSILAGTATEVATEEAQALVAMVGEVAGGRSVSSILEEAPDRLLEAGVAAGAVSGVTGGASAIYQRAGLAARGGQQAALDSPEGQAAWQRQLEQVLDTMSSREDAGEVAIEAAQLGAREHAQLGERWQGHHALSLPEALEFADAAEAAAPLGQLNYRGAELFGEENLAVRAIRNLEAAGLPKEAVNDAEIIFSATRAADKRAEAMRTLPVMSPSGRAVLPGLSYVMAPAHRLSPDLSTDPSPDWIYGFLSDVEAAEVSPLRNPLQAAAGHVARYFQPSQKRAAKRLFAERPGLKVVEELRWILRQESLQKRETQQRGENETKWRQELPDYVAQARERGMDPAQTLESMPTPEPTSVRTLPKINQEVADRHRYLRTLPEYNELRKVAEQLSEWDRTVMEMDVATGRVSKQQARDMIDAGEHYAPLFGMAEPPAPIARALHSTQEVAEAEPYQFLEQGLARGNQYVLPTVGSMRKAEAAMRRSYRQHSINEFRRLVELAPGWFSREGVYLDRRPPDADLPDTYRGENMPYWQIDAYREGSAQPMVMPEVWARAFESWPTAFSSTWVNTAAKVAGFATSLRRATSVLNPTFGAKTITRDQIATLWLGKKEAGYRPFVDFAKGAFHVLTGSDTYKAWEAVGIGGTSLVSHDLSQAHVGLDDVALQLDVANSNRMVEVLGAKLAKFGHSWRTALGATPAESAGAALAYPLAITTDVIDKSMRLGAAMRAADLGLGPEAASDASRRVGIDFSKGSKFSRQMGQLYPFFNPVAQDVALTWESAVRNPARLMAVAAGAVMLPELMHHLLHYDDEEYQAEPEWSKQRYYYLGRNDDGTWIQVPRPLGVVAQVFGYGFGEALRASYRSDPGSVGRVLSAFSSELPVIGQFSPVDWDDEGRPFPQFTSMMPEAVLPFVELGSNRKAFFNSEIVPNWMQSKPPNERAFRTTPQIYRDIAKALGPEVAPLQVEHVGRHILGSTGSSMVKTAQSAKALAKGEQLTWNEVPVLTAFIGSRRDAPSLAPVRRLFEYVNKDKAWARKKPDAASDEEYLGAHRDYRRAHEYLKRVRKLIEARNVMDELLEFDRRNEIDGEILRLATDALRQIGERGEPGSGPLGAFWDGIGSKIRGGEPQQEEGE